MTPSKKTLTVFFIIFGFLGLLLLIYVFRCKLFNLKSCVQDPNKTNTPVPSGSPTPKWVAESFRLNIGMFGPKIKALQTALGIAADGKFGSQTSGAITGAGYTVPLSQADYNAIVSPQSVTPPAVNPIGKIAYANKDGVSVFNANYSVYKTAANGDWIGTVIANASGTSINFYTIVGGYLVATGNVNLQ